MSQIVPFIVLVAILCCTCTEALWQVQLEECMAEADSQLEQIWIPDELLWLEKNYDMDKVEDMPLDYYTELAKNENSMRPVVFETYTNEIESILDDTQCGTGFLETYRDYYPEAYAKFESDHGEMMRKIKLARAADSFKSSVLDSYT